MTILCTLDDIMGVILLPDSNIQYLISSLLKMHCFDHLFLSFLYGFLGYVYFLVKYNFWKFYGVFPLILLSIGIRN